MGCVRYVRDDGVDVGGDDADGRTEDGRDGADFGAEDGCDDANFGAKEGEDATELGGCEGEEERCESEVAELHFERDLLVDVRVG